ncbi:MAG: hypothetical protein AAF593_06565 [Planctomycetota bacterium]
MDEAVLTSSGTRSAGAGGLGLRGLVLGWSLWLLGTWVVLWVVGGWTMPALRVMVLAALVGMMGVWPAVRLSQATPTRGHLHGNDLSGSDWARACGWIGADWLALNLVLQAVIWPLQLAAKWTLGQAVWLVVATAGWSLMTGLIIAWGRGTNVASWRSWAMVACIGVVVLEPLLWWMGWMTGGPRVGVPEMRFSPLQAVWGVSTAGTGAQAEAAIATHRFQIITVATASLVGWVVLWALLGATVWRERARGKRQD